MQPITCTIRREADVYVAVGRGRQIATSLGFNKTDCARIEIVILELARNLLAHAGGGELSFEPLNDTSRLGVAVVTSDTGPGIPNIELALQDGYSTANTYGCGLPSVSRLMDGLTIESTVGVGTYVRAVKWVPQGRGSKGRSV